MSSKKSKAANKKKNSSADKKVCSNCFETGPEGPELEN
jgi:hypothetical protein